MLLILTQQGLSSALLLIDPKHSTPKKLLTSCKQSARSAQIVPH
jgi:hypothetical protein